MEKTTKENIFKAFVGEAKAFFRLSAYAEKADEEKVPQIALLFRAIAEAERVHATRHLSLVKDIVVKDSDTNLEESFQREKSVSENEYPDFIKDAQKDGEETAALVFSQARDAATKDALRVAMGEFGRSDKKEISDGDVIKTLKKLIKSEKELLHQKGGADSSSFIDVLAGYLPQMADEAEITAWIEANIDFSQFKSKMQAMGPVMKHFGANADGNTVKAILQKL
jgi:uncharacterized protein YqeY